MTNRMNTCIACAHWRRDDPAPGKMPGAEDDSRECGRPRISKSVAEYRRPTDWCNQFTARAE